MFIRGVFMSFPLAFRPWVVVGGSFLAAPEAAFPASVWFLGGSGGGRGRGAVPSQEGCRVRPPQVQ